MRRPGRGTWCRRSGIPRRRRRRWRGGRPWTRRRWLRRRCRRRGWWSRGWSLRLGRRGRGRGTRRRIWGRGLRGRLLGGWLGCGGREGGDGGESGDEGIIYGRGMDGGRGKKKRRTFHRRDGVRVHVVEARVRRVGALGRRACGAGLEFAAGGSDGFGGGVGGAFILHGVSRPVHWIYTPLSLVLSF